MRVMKRNPWLTGLGTVLSLVGMWWGSAQGGVASTNQTASLVAFPKVIADGTRDTLIQLVNASSTDNYQVHCAYTNASGRCGTLAGTQVCTTNEDCPTGQTCVDIRWQENDWDLTLTHQQPTIWRASTGRNPNTGQDTVPGQCTQSMNTVRQDCPGAFGLLNSNASPAGGDVRGELRCWEVEASLQPIGFNALEGVAILETIGTGQISEYNGIGFRAINVDNTDPVLHLDNAEYDVCPASLQLTVYPVGADDTIARGFAGASCPTAGSCPVDTEITIIPCSTDYTPASDPSSSIVQFSGTNEFEQQLQSQAVPMTCYLSASLNSPSIGLAYPFSTAANGSLFKLKVRPASGGHCNGAPAVTCATLGATCPNGNGTCVPNAGILAVAEEFHTSANSSIVGTAAFNVDAIGARGVCAVSGNACTAASSAACNGGSADVCLIDSITTVINP